MVATLDGGRTSFIIVSTISRTANKKLPFIVKTRVLPTFHVLFTFVKNLYIIKWVISIYVHCPTSPVVILCCVKGIHVEELKHETALQRLIDSAIEELRESSKIKDKNNHNFPKNYQACIDIYRLLRIMAQVGMK